MATPEPPSLPRVLFGECEHSPSHDLTEDELESLKLGIIHAEGSKFVWKCDLRGQLVVVKASNNLLIPSNSIFFTSFRDVVSMIMIERLS